jgi:hypothetical protein
LAGEEIRSRDEIKVISLGDHIVGIYLGLQGTYEELCDSIENNSKKFVPLEKKWLLRRTNK